jgi:hypothetical protein
LKSRPPILALCLILLLFGGITDFGCTYRTSGTPSSEVYDSAGVRVVLSHSPVWGTESAWTISDTPILEIGLKEGENPYLLNRVMGATVTSQGTIVVANGGDCSIRAFGPDGKVVWVSGACGEGPEEFQRILGLFGAGGQIYVRQYPQASLRILDTHGTFIGTAFQNLPAEFRSSDPLGTFEDGSVLLGDKIRPNVDQGPFQVSYTVGRLRSDGEIDTLTTLPFLNSVRHQSGFRGAERPMKILSLAIHRDRIYYSWPDRYEINILGPDGKLETVIRRDWKPTAVSEEYVQRARERTMRGEGGVGGPPGFLREIVDEMVFSEFHPAHHGFHVDHSGNLWVLGADPRRWDYGRIPPRIFDESSSWDIFDPEGVWLGTVQTPPRFVLYEVGEDYLLGLWRDELEVEYVRRYELVRE